MHIPEDTAVGSQPMIMEYLNQDICQEIHTIWIIPEDVTVEITGRMTTEPWIVFDVLLYFELMWRGTGGMPMMVTLG